MDFNEFASLAIVGAAVSVFVQFIKASLGTRPSATISVLVAASILTGAVYYQFSETALWEAVVQVVLYANTVYLFLIKRME